MAGQKGAGRLCGKCLLREIPESEYFQTMSQYIAGLPREDKVSEEVYEERLAACRGCDELLEGMCRVCGCFVEMRAAMANRHCPGKGKAW